MENPNKHLARACKGDVQCMWNTSLVTETDALAWSFNFQGSHYERLPIPLHRVDRPPTATPRKSWSLLKECRVDAHRVASLHTGPHALAREAGFVNAQGSLWLGVGRSRERALVLLTRNSCENLPWQLEGQTAIHGKRWHNRPPGHQRGSRARGASNTTASSSESAEHFAGNRAYNHHTIEYRLSFPDFLGVCSSCVGMCMPCN